MALSKSQEEKAFSRSLVVCLSRFESMNQMYRETSQGEEQRGEGKPPCVCILSAARLMSYLIGPQTKTNETTDYFDDLCCEPRAAAQSGDCSST